MNGVKIAKNASWIIACSCIQAVLGLIITMLSARFLGPSNYGVLNYAISVTSFVIPVSLLGFNSVLVQELVAFKDDEGTIMGTALTMSLVSSMASIGAIALFVFIVNKGETETLIVCVLYSVMLLFQSLGLVRYWFQANLLSKYSSVVSVFAYLFVSFYKIYLLATHKSVRWFAISYAIDYFLIATILLIIYKKKGGKRLKFSPDVGKRMLSNSKYFIVSTLMVTLFAQQDKVMLKLILGNSETGIYSAAVTIATMSSFVFTAIIDSMRPVIFESKTTSLVSYEENITKTYSIVIYMCLLQSILISVLAKPVVLIIYGNGYVDAIDPLRILIWYSAFSYIGGIRDIWLLSEGKQKYLLVINFIGAILNMCCNYLFISCFGIKGAALASLITQVFTNIFMSYLIKPIRKNNYFILKSINPKYALTVAATFKSVLRRKG